MSEKVPMASYKAFPKVDRLTTDLESSPVTNTQDPITDRTVLDQFFSWYSSLPHYTSQGNAPGLLELLRNINIGLQTHKYVALRGVLADVPWLDTLETLIGECPDAGVCGEAIMCIYCTCSADQLFMQMIKRRDNLSGAIIDALDRYGTEVLHPSRLALDLVICEYDPCLLTTAYRIISDREGDNREFYVDMACIFSKMLSFGVPQDQIDTFVNVFLIILNHGVFEHVLDGILILIRNCPGSIAKMALPRESDPMQKIIMDHLIDIINVWEQLPIGAIELALTILCEFVHAVGGMRKACANSLHLEHAMELVTVANSTIQNNICELLCALCKYECEVISRIRNYQFVPEIMAHFSDLPYLARKAMMSAIAKMILYTETEALRTFLSRQLLEELDNYLEEVEDAKVMKELLIACHRVVRIPSLQERFKEVLGHHFQGTDLVDRLQADNGLSTYAFLIQICLEEPH